MSTVREHPTDPITVAPSPSETRVELRIGEAQGSRFALLTASEARIVAYALLAEAERLDAKG